jgi:hypothetical protein
MLLSKVNKEKMLTKPSPHPLSSIAVEISSPRKYRGRRVEGDCEKHVEKVLRFLSQLRPRIPPLCLTLMAVILYLTSANCDRDQSAFGPLLMYFCLFFS